MGLLRRIARASSFAGSPFRIVTRIHPFESVPSTWKITFGTNRVDRTDWSACSTIDTFHWIDKEHRDGPKIWIIPCRMDAINRADIHACGIFYSDARFCNDIGHDPLSIWFGEGGCALLSKAQYTNYSALAPCSDRKAARGHIAIRLERSICRTGLVLLTKHPQNWGAQSVECVCGRDWGRERYIPKEPVQVECSRIACSTEQDHGR